MDDDLPLEYDVIVIGTGMTESIVAAALSRIGKKVLHLDSEQYYGGLWASFNFKDLQKTLDANIKEKTNLGVCNIISDWYIKERNSSPKPVDKIIPDPSIEIQENLGDETLDENKQEKTEDTKPCLSKVENDPIEIQKPEWTQESVQKEYRKFNIDLVPKLLFARGELVELLISSNIARYMEFRCVNRVLTSLNSQLEPVPCSRADVFSTKHVSVVEKRMLMKLLTSLLDYDPSKTNEEFQDMENKSFLEYLKTKKLTNNLIHYVLYAIAGGTDETPCKDGVVRCKKFLSSLGRYGNTPFLWTMYGCGELPQSFCRLCAVFGGIYYLNRPIENIETLDNAKDARNIQVITNGKALRCEHLVMGVDKAPADFLMDVEFTKGISRAVFIIDKSIHTMEKESLTLLQYPPLKKMKKPVTIIELGSSTCACPKDLYVLHMTSVQISNAKDDLKPYADKLLFFPDPEKDASKKVPNNKPKVLWSIYFNMMDTSHEDLHKSSRKNVYICSGPDIELDFDHAVNEAREIFSKICEGAEFLPRAPDPDEIVFEGSGEDPGPVFEKDVSKIKSEDTEEEKKSQDIIAEKKSEDVKIEMDEEKLEETSDNVKPDTQIVESL